MTTGTNLLQKAHTKNNYLDTISMDEEETSQDAAMFMNIDGGLSEADLLVDEMFAKGATKEQRLAGRCDTEEQQKTFQKWMQRLDNLADFDEVRAQQDSEFPATDAGIISTWTSHSWRGPPGCNAAVQSSNWLQWTTMHEVATNHNIPFAVFGAHGVSVSDIDQGGLGNCYFLAAVAAIAFAQPKVIDDMFIRRDLWPDSVYTTRWYAFGKYIEVAVDDYVPGNDAEGLFFTNFTHDGGFWPVILAKAWAKIFGAYCSAEGGAVHAVFKQMTQAPLRYFVVSDQTDSQGEPLADYSDDDIWELLAGGAQKGHAMAASCIGGLGLVGSHAYALLKVSDTLDGEAPGRYVNMYNPWGKDHYAGSLEHLNTEKADGQFWMTFAEFRATFASVTIAELIPGAVVSTVTVPSGSFAFDISIPDGEPAALQMIYPGGFLVECIPHYHPITYQVQQKGGYKDGGEFLGYARGDWATGYYGKVWRLPGGTVYEAWIGEENLWYVEWWSLLVYSATPVKVDLACRDGPWIGDPDWVCAEKFQYYGTCDDAIQQDYISAGSLNPMARCPLTCGGPSVGCPFSKGYKPGFSCVDQGYQPITDKDQCLQAVAAAGYMEGSTWVEEGSDGCTAGACNYFLVPGSGIQKKVGLCAKLDGLQGYPLCAHLVPTSGQSLGPHWPAASADISYPTEADYSTLYYDWSGPPNFAYYPCGLESGGDPKSIVLAKRGQWCREACTENEECWGYSAKTEYPSDCFLWMEGPLAKDSSTSHRRRAAWSHCYVKKSKQTPPATLSPRRRQSSPTRRRRSAPTRRRRSVAFETPSPTDQTPSPTQKPIAPQTPSTPSPRGPRPAPARPAQKPRPAQTPRPAPARAPSRWSRRRGKRSNRTPSKRRGTWRSRRPGQKPSTRGGFR